MTAFKLEYHRFWRINNLDRVAVVVVCALSRPKVVSGRRDPVGCGIHVLGPRVLRLAVWSNPAKTGRCHQLRFARLLSLCGGRFASGRGSHSRLTWRAGVLHQELGRTAIYVGGLLGSERQDWHRDDMHRTCFGTKICTAFLFCNVLITLKVGKGIY